MFLHLSVRHSVHGGVPAPLHAGIHHWAGTPLGRYNPWAGTAPGMYTPSSYTPLARQVPPRQVHPQAGTPLCTVHAGIRSTSGQYTSHWNAILFHICLSAHGGGSLSREVSVQGCLCAEGLCPGRLCQGMSLPGGSLSSGVSVQWISVQRDLCQGDSPYGKEWAVCILLECILVNFLFSRTKFQKLKSSIGWQLVYCPKSILNAGYLKDNVVSTITLNPSCVFASLVVNINFFSVLPLY